jgi:hypothetical protein
MSMVWQRCQDRGHATKRDERSTSRPSPTWAGLVAPRQEHPSARRGVGGDGAQGEAMAPDCSSPEAADGSSGSRASSSVKAPADGTPQGPGDARGLCSRLGRRLLDARPHRPFDLAPVWGALPPPLCLVGVEAQGLEFTKPPAAAPPARRTRRGALETLWLATDKKMAAAPRAFGL